MRYANNLSVYLQKSKILTLNFYTPAKWIVLGRGLGRGEGEVKSTSPYANRP